MENQHEENQALSDKHYEAPAFEVMDLMETVGDGRMASGQQLKEPINDNIPQ